MNKEVDFRLVFIENSLLEKEEKQALNFFNLLRSSLDYSKDKSFLDHISLVAQATDSKIFIKELERIGLPCDTLRYKYVEYAEDDVEGDSYFVDNNSYTKAEYIEKYKTMDNAFIVPDSYEKESFSDEVYKNIIERSPNAIFGLGDFTAYRTAKDIWEKKVRTSLCEERKDSLFKSFAYTEEDFDLIASSVCERIRTNRHELLSEHIDERAPIKEKIIDYFKNNSFYLSSGDSFSSSRDIFDTINDIQYYTDSFNSVYIQNDKDTSIVLTTGFFPMKDKIDYLKDVVKNVKKQIYKTYDESLNAVINQDLVNADGGAVVVFKNSNPIAVFTNDDFENKLVSWEEIKNFDLAVVKDLIKDFDKKEMMHTKEWMIKAVNDLFEEKQVLEYLPNKFSSKVETNEDFKEIRKRLKPFESVVKYDKKDELTGAGDIIIYTSLNKDKLIHNVLKEVDNKIFSDNLKKLDTNPLLNSQTAKNLKKDR